MDWKMQGCRVIHKSGFSLSVQDGSFEFPYEISYAGADGLSPATLARMIRSALYHGRIIEREARDPQPSHSDRSPQVIVKHRRSVSRRCVNKI